MGAARLGFAARSLACAAPPPPRAASTPALLPQTPEYVRRYALPEIVNSRNPATRNGEKSSDDGDDAKMDGGDSEGGFLSSSEEEDDS